MLVLTRIFDRSWAELWRQAVPLLDDARMSSFRGVDKALEQAIDAGQVLLVTDLMPDPAGQFDWLSRIHKQFPALSFYLLLLPRAEVLWELALRGSHLPLAGLELWTPDLGPEQLANRLRACLDGRVQDMRLWRRVQSWCIASGFLDTRAA